MNNVLNKTDEKKLFCGNSKRLLVVADCAKLEHFIQVFDSSNGRYLYKKPLRVKNNLDGFKFLKQQTLKFLSKVKTTDVDFILEDPASYSQAFIHFLQEDGFNVFYVNAIQASKYRDNSRASLGTAFGSEVLEGEMDLHVFEGSVEFGSQKIKAYEGDAYSLKRNLLHKIKYNPEKFLTKVPEGFPEQKRNLLAGEILDFTLNKAIDRLKLDISPIGIEADHGKFEFQVSSGGEILKTVNLVDLKGSKTLLLENLAGLSSLSFTLVSYRKGGVDEAAGSLNITLYDFPRSPEVLITNKASWHYQKSIFVPNTDWYKMKSIPNGWLKGQSPIGFGREVSTELKKEDSPLYVYKSFMVSDVPENGMLLLNHSFDDGGIVYLNGREIFRINVEDKFVDQNSRTKDKSESSSESIFTTVKIPATYLKKGKNVLTAAVCQYSKGSDMLFDIKLSLQRWGLFRYGAKSNSC